MVWDSLFLDEVVIIDNLDYHFNIILDVDFLSVIVLVLFVIKVNFVYTLV